MPGFHLTSSSQRRAGGTSVLVALLVSSPPPVLHPVHSYAAHLSPPVHKNWPFEILDLDSLHDLPVEGLLEDPSDSHAVVDIHSALVVVHAVQPQDRLVLVTGFPVVKVLSSSGEAIPARLALVSSNLFSTLVTPEVVGDGLLPAIASLLSSTLKEIFRLEQSR